MRWVLVALLGMYCLPLHARASDLDVDWEAPEQACPSRDALIAGLAAQLQREVSVGPAAPVQLVGKITQEDLGFVLTLRLSSALGADQRTLRAAGCSELASAAIVIAALRLTQTEPPPPAAAPPPDARIDTAPSPVPPPSARSRLTRAFYLRAQLVGDWGTFPSLAWGPSVMLGASLGPLALELGGLHLVSQQLVLDQRVGPVGAVQLTTAAAVGCYRVLQRPWLAPCLLAEVGRLAAEGLDVAQPERRALLWAMVGVSARIALDITRWLRWHAELTGGLPWDRAELALRDLGPVHRIPAVIARLSTGLEGTF